MAKKLKKAKRKKKKRHSVDDDILELAKVCSRKSKPLSKDWQKTIDHLNKMGPIWAEEAERRQAEAMREANRMLGFE